MNPVLEKSMATRQEEALTVLQQAQADEVAVSRLDDGTILITVVPPKKPQANKWARFADDMHEASPLKGHSAFETERGREFRDRFSFERE